MSENTSKPRDSLANTEIKHVFRRVTDESRVDEYAPDILSWLYDSGKADFDLLFEHKQEAHKQLAVWMKRPSSAFSIRCFTLLFVEQRPLGGFIGISGKDLLARTRDDTLTLIRQGRETGGSDGAAPAAEVRFPSYCGGGFLPQGFGTGAAAPPQRSRPGSGGPVSGGWRTCRLFSFQARGACREHPGGSCLRRSRFSCNSRDNRAGVGQPGSVHGVGEKGIPGGLRPAKGGAPGLLGEGSPVMSALYKREAPVVFTPGAFLDW